MRNVIPVLFAVICIGSPQAAEAEPWLNYEYQYYKNTAGLSVHALELTTGYQADSGALGGYMYAYVSPGYAQGHAGPTLAFPLGNDGSVTVGAGMGLEQGRDENPFRMASFASVDTGSHLFFAAYELGVTRRGKPENHYFDLRYAWHAHQHFDLGAMARRGIGVGPRLDYWLKRSSLGLWMAPFYEPESEAWGGQLSFVVGY